MNTFMQWVHATYPNFRPNELSEMKIEWLEVMVMELSAEVEALKPKPIAPDVFAPAAKFPRISADICRCGENKDHDIVCPNCGGLLF